jgi:hypothetical protein
MDSRNIKKRKAAAPTPRIQRHPGETEDASEE